MVKTLDLHGTKHSEVEIKVENFILDYQTEFPMKIITGNSQRMKNIVKNVLDRHNFIYNDGDPINRGYITVLA